MPPARCALLLESHKRRLRRAPEQTRLASWRTDLRATTHLDKLDRCSRGPPLAVAAARATHGRNMRLTNKDVPVQRDLRFLGQGVTFLISDDGPGGAAHGCF